jgi:hypothetical protein
VAEQYESNPRSVWGYVQGLTRVSQRTPWQDGRFALDRAASRLLSWSTDAEQAVRASPARLLPPIRSGRRPDPPPHAAPPHAVASAHQSRVFRHPEVSPCVRSFPVHPHPPSPRDDGPRRRDSGARVSNGPRVAALSKGTDHDCSSPAAPDAAPPRHVRELVCTYRPLRDASGRIIDAPALSLSTPRMAAVALAPLIADQVVEVFGVACLSTRLHLLAWHLLSRGTRSEYGRLDARCLRTGVPRTGHHGIDRGAQPPERRSDAQRRRHRVDETAAIRRCDPRHPAAGSPDRRRRRRGTTASGRPARSTRSAPEAESRHASGPFRPSRLAIVRRRSAPSSLGALRRPRWGYRA